MSQALSAAIDKVMTPKSEASPFWQQNGKSPPAPKLSLHQQNASALMAEALTMVKYRQFPAAAPLLMKACALWPTNADILFQCGSVLLEIGQHAEALKKLDSAVALRPRWSDAHNNRSAALARMGMTEEAIAAAEKAVETGQNYAAMANLCAAYSGKGDNEKAVAHGEQAVRLSQGNNPMALINYGVAMRAIWKLSEAAGAQERAIEVTQGQDYMAWSNLGAIRNLQGRNHEAMIVTQRAVELQPQNAALQGNMVMFSDLLPETTLLEALHRRRHFAYTFEAPLKRLWKAHQCSPDPDRKLRVGYVGSDFRQHSAAHIHGAVIRAHDPEQVEVYVLAGNRYEDEISAKIREAPALTEWVQTSAMSDPALADWIYAHQIDILVDCASFTSGGRLGTFAYKPAPIQMTAWGYANGTGLEAMDFFVADDVIVPPELEYGYSEQILRMPNLLCFDPFLELPPPGPPPVKTNGYVTFGSYNRVEKISPQILSLWCEVMKQIPDSRMVLKFGGLEGETAEQLLKGFEHHGIARSRVETRGHTPRDEHIRQYSEIDIMLDTWPHVGGITTLEALMMGVPCVTLLGDRAPSRVSASILTTLGMPDWIADSPERYLAIALERAAADLSELRASIPDRVRASVIGDTKRYTQILEQKYREIWRAYCTQVAPAGEQGA